MKITELYIYPIKSLQPCSVPRTRLRPEGPEHDRRFMLLRGDGEGRYTNIQVAYFPECTLFNQEIDGDDIVVTYRGALKGEGGDGDKQAKLHVPLIPSTDGLETVEVKLFGSTATAYRMGDEPYDSWFSARFGYRVMLVYIGDSQRKVLAHSPNNIRASDKIDVTTKQGWLSSLASYVTGGTVKQEQEDSDFLTFNEAAPFLVTSRASLRNVNGRLPRGEDVNMINFRPNIVVDDDNGEEEEEDESGSTPLKAWEEDYWAELLVGSGTSGGEPRLALTANCARCISINIDYETGRPAEGERGSVLKKLMRDRRVDSGNKWSPIFGRYAFLLLTPAAATTAANTAAAQLGHEEGDVVAAAAAAAAAAADIAVGDEVSVTKRINDRDVWSWPKTS